MNPNKPFINGIQGTLCGTWDVKLMTPLIIRHGSKAAWQTQPASDKKGRNQALRFSWFDAQRKIENDWSEVTDFNYHFSVIEDQLAVHYDVSASSIRGALRQWSIKNMIEQKDWNTFDVPKKDDLTQINIPKYIEKAIATLEDQRNRWSDILSLFGCAYDLDPKISDPLAWLGRLQLNTSIPIKENKTLDVQGSWASQTIDGPNNINRHVTVRNPLDRVSAAAKEGGLHQFMEMSEGEKFKVEFHILNPSKVDLEMLELWVNDINAGYLRFGALASQGRGRVEIQNHDYKLFISPSSPLAHFLDQEKTDLSTGSLFEGIWRGYQLSFNELMDLYSTLK